MNKCQQEFEKCLLLDAGGYDLTKNDNGYVNKNTMWSYHIWLIAWDKSRSLLLNAIKELSHE